MNELRPDVLLRRIGDRLMLYVRVAHPLVGVDRLRLVGDVIADEPVEGASTALAGGVRRNLANTLDGSAYR